jgi:hypothetical protein
MPLFLSCSRCDLFEIFGRVPLVGKIIDPTTQPTDMPRGSQGRFPDSCHLGKSLPADRRGRADDRAPHQILPRGILTIGQGYADYHY